ncbi:MAG: DUF3253 domain-containing protein [Gemmatimonadales bacterium]|jgi:hypothetical protein
MLEKSGMPRFWNLLDEIDRELELAVLRLLGSRGPGAAISLREAALAVGGESWQALIERAYSVTSDMAAEGIVELLAPGDKGEAGDRAAARVRLKLRRSQEYLAPSRLN